MSASGTRTGHWEVLHVGGGGLGVQPGQGLCTRGEPGEARHQCGQAHPQRLEAGAPGMGLGPCLNKDTRHNQRPDMERVPEWGTWVGVLEKGGDLRAEGEGFAVFPELCTANCEVRGNCPQDHSPF